MSLIPSTSESSIIRRKTLNGLEIRLFPKTKQQIFVRLKISEINESVYSSQKSVWMFWKIIRFRKNNKNCNLKFRNNTFFSPLFIDNLVTVHTAQQTWLDGARSPREEMLHFLTPRGGHYHISREEFIDGFLNVRVLLSVTDNYIFMNHELL